MTKVFVTGGAGFVGSHVVKRLVEQGCDITVYDSYVIYSPVRPGEMQPNFAVRLADVFDRIDLVRGDTLNKDYLRRQLNAIAPQVIVHTAAMPLASLALEYTEEAFASILVSTLNILEIMRDFEHPCRLVFVSSSMVYGDFTSESVAEDHPTNPRDVYGAFKLAGETIVCAYARNFGIEATIVRPSAVYGPYEANSRVIQKFIRAALNGEPLTIDGDGSLRMDFTHVEDCAEGIVLCATHPAAAGHTFNITRGEARSLAEAAEAVKAHIPTVEVIHRPKPAHVPVRGTLDIARARDTLGFDPTIRLEDGIASYIEHLTRHSF